MSELQFPKDPIVGQQYDFPPYKYYWDGIKWKTMGIGHNPVNDLRDELEPRINAVSAQSFEALRRSYAEAGYNLVDGSFETGGNLAATTDVMLQESTGAVYAWAGSFPKVVPSGTNPATSGSGYVSRTDVLLRDEIEHNALKYINGVYVIRSRVCLYDYLTLGQIAAIENYEYPDITTELQTALADTNNANKLLHAPAGGYGFSSRLIQHIPAILGDGRGRTRFKFLNGGTGDTGAKWIDQGTIDGTTVLSNFVLSGLTIDFNDYNAVGCSGMHMYRTNNPFIDDVEICNTAGTTLRWSYSQIDAGRVRLRNVYVHHAHQGDGAQGVGDDVIIDSCYGYSCGDTCFAGLYDSNSTTNPSGIKPKSFKFINTHAKGEYDSSGVFQGSGRSAQLGFALGPYSVDADVNVMMSGCTTEGLYTNVWMSVFRSFEMVNCKFGSHANKTTCGCRFDGINYVTIGSGCTFDSFLTATQNTHGALGFFAQSFVYGGTTFTCSISSITIASGVVFNGSANTAIVVYIDPAVATVDKMGISSPILNSVATGVSILMASSTGTNILKRFSITDAIAGSSLTALVSTTGARAQYDNCDCLDNNIGSSTPVSGTGAGNWTVRGSYRFEIIADSGVATAVTTLTRRHTEVMAYVSTGTNPEYSCMSTFLWDGSGRIALNAPGTGISLSVSGSTVKVTHTGLGGTQTVRGLVKYL